MPIRPKPYTIVCAHCHWSRTFRPASDALRHGIDIVSECAKCGSVDLERRKATALEKIALPLSEYFNRHMHTGL